MEGVHVTDDVIHALKLNKTFPPLSIPSTIQASPPDSNQNDRRTNHNESLAIYLYHTHP